MLKTECPVEKSLNRAILVAFGISSFAAILFGGMSFSQNAFAGVSENNGQEKITICHIDQDTGEEKTITVAELSVEKHLANHYGDHIGECSEITCEQCYQMMLTEVEECQDDFSCIQQSFQDYAECSLTCSGELSVFTQECVNDSATYLESCVEQAQSMEDIFSCFDGVYYEHLVACNI
jgi:hypothetical protein